MSRSILLVDDSPTVRELLGLVLETFNCHVTASAGGRHALETATHKMFDLVITDLSMPEGDGFALIRNLRKLSRYAKTPILVLTANTKQPFVDESRKAGATGLVPKPFDAQVLKDLLGRLLPRAS